MNMCELIVKKKRGGRLNEKEIDWIVQGYTAGEIPDYQMSAMTMVPFSVFSSVCCQTFMPLARVISSLVTPVPQMP